MITETLYIDVQPADSSESAPADRRERIPDPTVRSVLPSNLLAALGNTHACMFPALLRLMDVIDTLGWPHDRGRAAYEPLAGGDLANALDYARANAQLSWTLIGLVDVLTESLGQIVRDEHGELVSVGGDDLADQIASPVPQPAGSGRGETASRTP